MTSWLFLGFILGLIIYLDVRRANRKRERQRARWEADATPILFPIRLRLREPLPLAPDYSPQDRQRAASVVIGLIYENLLAEGYIDGPSVLSPLGIAKAENILMGGFFPSDKEVSTELMKLFKKYDLEGDFSTLRDLIIYTLDEEKNKQLLRYCTPYGCPLCGWNENLEIEDELEDLWKCPNCEEVYHLDGSTSMIVEGWV